MKAQVTVGPQLNMKFRYPSVLLLAILPCSAEFATSASPKESPSNSVSSAKPYSLEVRYGESAAAIPQGSIPTPADLARAAKIDLAVAETDEGSVAIQNAELTYKLKKGKASFPLQIKMRASHDERHSSDIATSVSLPENAWLVIGRSKTSDGTSERHFYIAVRIEKRG